MLDGTGRVLGVRNLGEGPPLLLLNGYSGTAADWDPTFLATLAGAHTVVAPDHQGMGRSSAGDLDQLTIDSMADDVAVVLDGLGIDRVPVVGWSMGGMVAQAFARRHARRVQAMVLIGTDAGGPEALLADPDDWDRLVDHTGSPRQQATRLLHLLFPPDVAAEVDQLFGDVVAEARAELSPEALAAQERAIAAWHATDPGRPVGPVPPTNADLVAEQWDAARIESFAGGGHAVMAQEPERIGTMITSFLDTID